MNLFLIPLVIFIPAQISALRESKAAPTEKLVRIDFKIVRGDPLGDSVVVGHVQSDLHHKRKLQFTCGPNVRVKGPGPEFSEPEFKVEIEAFSHSKGRCAIRARFTRYSLNEDNLLNIHCPAANLGHQGNGTKLCDPVKYRLEATAPNQQTWVEIRFGWAPVAE